MNLFNCQSLTTARVVLDDYSALMEVKIEPGQSLINVNNIIVLNNTGDDKNLGCCAYLAVNNFQFGESMLIEKFIDSIYKRLFTDAGFVITNSKKDPTIYILINKFETDRACYPLCHPDGNLAIPALEKRYLYLSNEIWIRDANSVYFTTGSKSYEKFFFRAFWDLFSSGLSQFVNESFALYSIDNVNHIREYLVNQKRKK